MSEPAATETSDTPAAAEKPRVRVKATSMNISDSLLAKTSRPLAGQPIDPFAIARFPESVEKQAERLAADEALISSAQWATAAFSIMSTSGVGFLGYPVLAEMSQRTEYRRAVEIIAQELTREWFDLTYEGDGDATGKLTKIKQWLEDMNAQTAVQRALEIEGFFGRSHVFIDTGDVDNDAELKTPIGDGYDAISRVKVSPDRPVRRLRVVEPVWTYPQTYGTRDPLRSDWYAPQNWLVQGRQVATSRLLTFIFRPVSDLLKPAYAFGGIPLIQLIKPYIENWVRSQRSVGDTLHSFSVSGFKTAMAAALAVNEEQLEKRAQLFKNMRDNRGVFVLDKDTEDFFNVSTPLSSLDKLQAQAQEQCASAAGIPLVKYTGISPSGLNATSEFEMEAWEQWIKSQQETHIRPAIKSLIGFAQLSLYGVVDPAIGFKFNPIKPLSDKEAAEVRMIKAQTDEIMIRSRTLGIPEARTRVASDPDSDYASLNPNAVPPLGPVEQAQLDSTVAGAVVEVAGAALIGDQTALKILRRQPTFSEISDAEIAAADLLPPEPPAEAPMLGPDGQPMPGAPVAGAEPTGASPDDQTQPAGQQALAPAEAA